MFPSTLNFSDDIYFVEYKRGEQTGTLQFYKLSISADNCRPHDVHTSLKNKLYLFSEAG